MKKQKLTKEQKDNIIREIESDNDCLYVSDRIAYINLDVIHCLAHITTMLHTIYVMGIPEELIDESIKHYKCTEEELDELIKMKKEEPSK